jgi:16S rRNA (uracil1498-N3)-methyltransferase
MQVPYFFEENLPPAVQFNLSEESSKHIVQVLRMQRSEKLLITNGKGETLTALITEADKRHTSVEVIDRSVVPPPAIRVTVAISLIKSKSRFEWFLEKATELGVAEVIPILCQRTEKQHFNLERMQHILVSAMLQSQQAWLPALNEPVAFRDVIGKYEQVDKFIAHCNQGDKIHLRGLQPGMNGRLILIGPEGDFSDEEISMALQEDFTPVTLGETRLRTETAGLVAAVLLLNT